MFNKMLSSLLISFLISSGANALDKSCDSQSQNIGLTSLLSPASSASSGSFNELDMDLFGDLGDLKCLEDWTVEDLECGSLEGLDTFDVSNLEHSHDSLFSGESISMPSPLLPSFEYASSASSSACSGLAAQSALARIVSPATTAGQNKFVCSEPACQKRFKSTRDLQRHERIHSGERPFVCNFTSCSKRFAQEDNLTRHMNIHLGIKNFECKSCTRNFHQKSHLIEHKCKAANLLPMPSLLGYDLTPSSSSSSSSSYRHQPLSFAYTPTNSFSSSSSSLQPQLPSELDCSPMGDASQASSSLPALASRSSAVNQLQKGLKRGRTVVSPDGQLGHEESKLEAAASSSKKTSAQARFTCQTCGRTDDHLGHFKEHLLSHTEIKIFACSICNQGFSAKGGLNRHMRTHSGTQPFSCDFINDQGVACDKSFSQSTNLKRHKIIHSNIKPFVCAYCQQAFAQKVHMEVHMNRLHLPIASLPKRAK